LQRAAGYRVGFFGKWHAKTPASFRPAEHFDEFESISRGRDERYKYARYFDQDPAYEFLHDLNQDPDELVNLASDERHRATLAAMRNRCDALVERYGGPLLPLSERKR
jgi:arylsulfatase A-like enzyme